MKILRISARYA